MDFSKDNLFRNLRALADSPAPPTPLRQLQQDNGDAGLSPMSGLAQHLGCATLHDLRTSPRRRLSLSSVITGTPSPLHLRHKLLHDLNNSGISDASMSDSPTVFKQVARISGGPNSPPRFRHATDKENSANAPISPQRSPIKLIKSPLRRKRTPLEEHADSNSRDSGLEVADPSSFRFAEPLAPVKISPRKGLVASPQHDMTISPVASPARSSSLFRCLSSGSESIDDGFLEFLALDKEDDENARGMMPVGLGSLLSGEIMRRSSPQQRGLSNSTGRCGSSAKRSLHRSLSMADTPVSSRARSCLFRSPSVEDVRGGFKRPEPPCVSPDDCGPSKRRRGDDHEDSSEQPKVTLLGLAPDRPRAALTQSSLLNYGFQRNNTMPTPQQVSPKSLQRCFSESEATIKRALQRSLTEPDLIGDFTKPFVLPLMEGSHPDLKTISSATLADLLRGNFDSEVASYTVIDCRYPYEYSGGHIRGSRNVYTKEHVSEVFICGTGELASPRHPRTQSHKRHVLVFHCEFSSQRAPTMSRHLRQLDRDANKECYPQLHYPEVYLLHGGYKAFYESHKELCEPCGYVPMLSSGNEADLRLFRAKSRSWAGDPKSSAGPSRFPPKYSLKRLDV